MSRIYRSVEKSSSSLFDVGRILTVFEIGDTVGERKDEPRVPDVQRSVPRSTRYGGPKVGD